MSGELSREELAARLEAVEARADAKFTALLSEIKESRSEMAKEVAVLASDVRGDLKTFKAEIGAQVAQAASQKTVWAAVGTAIGVILFGLIATIVVLYQVGQTGYDTGINAEQRAAELAREAAQLPPQKAE